MAPPSELSPTQLRPPSELSVAQLWPPSQLIPTSFQTGCRCTLACSHAGCGPHARVVYNTRSGFKCRVARLDNSSTAAASAPRRCATLRARTLAVGVLQALPHVAPTSVGTCAGIMRRWNAAAGCDADSQQAAAAGHIRMHVRALSGDRSPGRPPTPDACRRAAAESASLVGSPARSAAGWRECCGHVLCTPFLMWG